MGYANGRMVQSEATGTSGTGLGSLPGFLTNAPTSSLLMLVNDGIAYTRRVLWNEEAPVGIALNGKISRRWSDNATWAEADGGDC